MGFGIGHENLSGREAKMGEMELYLETEIRGLATLREGPLGRHRLLDRTLKI